MSRIGGGLYGRFSARSGNPSRLIRGACGKQKRKDGEERAAHLSYAGNVPRPGGHGDHRVSSGTAYAQRCHPRSRIDRFREEHAFLSNFYETPVAFEGAVYPTGELAFQAAMTSDPAERARVAEEQTAGVAKKIGGS